MCVREEAGVPRLEMPSRERFLEEAMDRQSHGAAAGVVRREPGMLSCVRLGASESPGFTVDVAAS